MGWASRRRLIIMTLVAATIVAVLALVLEAFLYQTPSCADRVENQGEQGVDCGGPCAKLCSAFQSAPVVRFTKLLTPSPHRTDIIAYVDNANVSSGAKDVPYTITLYASNHSVLKKSLGTLDLPPAGTVPVFVPNFFNDAIEGSRAFLTIDPSRISWVTVSSLPKLQVGNPVLAGTVDMPQVRALLSNSDTTSFRNTKVVAIVFDSFGNIMAASQTLIPNIPALGSVETIFIWNSAFERTPTRIEVIPLNTL